MPRRRVFFFLFAALALAAASAAFALSIAASRQPTPTPTAGPTPTPEPRKAESLLKQHAARKSAPSSWRAAAPTPTSSCSPALPLFAAAPVWQRRMRSRLKVLAVPLVSGRSHLFVMHAVAAELAARGHEVKMLVVEDDVPAVPETVFNSSLSSSSSKGNLEILPYSSLRDFAWWRDYQEKQASASPLQDDHARAWVAAADALLSDSEMMKRLKDWNPDVVVGDTAYLATYGLAASLGTEEEEEEKGTKGSGPEALSSSPSSSSSSLSSPPPRRWRGLPFATVSCTGIIDPVHGWLMRFENDAGAIPQFGSGLRAPMTFPDQLRNRAFKLLASLYFRRAFLKLWRPVMLKHGIPLPGSKESVPRELGHVFNASPMLEWQRALPPHVKLVGPILMDLLKEGKEEERVVAVASSAAVASSSPSSSASASSLNGRKDERAPLPPQVAALVEAASRGLSPPVVFVSFGTTVRLTAEDARAVAAALRSLAPRKVVWKLAAGDLGGGLKPDSLLAEVQGNGEERNIVAVPWLPQQSLLSKKTKKIKSPSSSSPSSPPSPVVAAFVTHGGMNGLYEAAASGVPVVGVPFFGDGEENLEKAAGRGIGVTIGRGGLRRQRKKDERSSWWSGSKKTNATVTAPSPSSLPSCNLNASDPTTGTGKLALALRTVLDDPNFSREASRMARGLRARAEATGRLPREEAADAVELGAWEFLASSAIAAEEGGEACTAAAAAASVTE